MQNRWSQLEFLKRVEADLLFEKQHGLLLVCAVLVGSIGLNLNSMPMILGAKLFSPLMPSIIGLGVGLSLLDGSMIKRSFRTLSFQVLVALFLSTVYFLCSPLKAVGSELAGQVSPNLWNIVISFIGGLAGAIGIRRKEANHLAAGVALATSLVPPLCAAGYGIANWDLAYLKGALYLFVLNVFFILLGHYLVSYLLGEAKRKQPTGFVVLTLLVILSLALSFPAKSAADKLVFQENIQTFVARELPSHTLVSQNFDEDKQVLTLLVAGLELTKSELDLIEERRSHYDLQHIQLVVQQMTTLSETDETKLNQRMTSLVEEQVTEDNTARD